MDFLKAMESLDHLCIDTEADYKVEPRLFLGFSLASYGHGAYFPVGHLEEGVNIDSEVYEYAFRVMQNVPLRVFQHAGHDLMELEELGYSMWDSKWFCTLIGAHMVNENLRSKSLDSLHKHYTGGVGKIRDPLMQEWIDKMGWRYVPVMLMNEYATQDAVATDELFRIIKPLYEAEYGSIYN